MKTKSNILTLIILCSLLFILISSASAAEKINTTVEDNAVESNLGIDELDNIDTNDILGVSDVENNKINTTAYEIENNGDNGFKTGNEDILKASSSDVSTFAELSAAIGNSNIDTINIQNDIALTSRLTISHTLTINGNGHILNGNGQKSGFFITSGRIEFNNVSIINCYSGSDSGDIDGGAINYLRSGGSLYLNHCIFEGNYAWSVGGAINTQSDIYVDDCLFIRNGLTYTFYGGKAIRVNSCKCSVKSSAFLQHGDNTFRNDGSPSFTLQNCWWGSNSGYSSDSNYLMAKSEFINCTVINGQTILFFKTIFYKKTDSSQTPVSVSWTRPVTGTNIYGNTSYGYIFREDLPDSNSVSYAVDNQQLSFVNPYSFTALQNLINSASGTLNLEHDYYHYSGDSHISVSKSLIINGNNHTLDSKNIEGKIFEILSGPTGLVVNDISFVNSTVNAHGSAIYYAGSGTLEINNCNFTNCRSTYTSDDTGGGAIVNYGADSFILNNCNFVSCTSAQKGGALSNVAGALTVNDCTFERCVVSSVSTLMQGGAIYASGSSITIIHSRFNNNTAGNAAVYIDNDKGAATTIIADSNFTNNYATGFGGALTVYSKSVTIDKSNFINNTVITSSTYRGGGAIAISLQSSGKLTLTNSNFIHNTANTNDGSNVESVGGGVGYLTGSGTHNINNCSFIDNYGYYGGVFIAKTTVNIYGSLFLNNSGKWSSIMRTWGSITVTVKDSIILNSSRSSSGTNYEIFGYNDGTPSYKLNYNWWGHNSTNKNTLTKAIPSKPTSSTLDRWLYLDVDYADLSYENVRNITYSLNHYATSSATGSYDASALPEITFNAYSDSGDRFNVTPLKNGEFNVSYVLPNDNDYSLTVNYNTAYHSYIWDSFTALKFEIGLADDVLNLYHDYHYYLGDSMISLVSKSLIINGNNNALDAKFNGAAQMFTITSGNIVLNDISFVNSTANGYGGAIYYGGSGTLEINYCNFTNCKSTYTGSSDGGGAIAHRGGDSFTLNACNFLNCTSARNGGAVSNIAGTLTADKCNFTDCQAGMNGGGIYSSSSLEVNNCNFNNNIAQQAGGIYSQSTMVVTGSNFTNCNSTTTSASQGGGGIYSTNSLTLGNSNFFNCAAVRGGGGVVTTGGTLSVTDCNFTKCKSGIGFAGSGVRFEGSNKLNIINCNFNELYGQDEIYSKSSTSISRSTFNNCTSDSSYATLHIENALAIEGCSFYNNTRDIYTQGTCTVSNCNFTKTSESSVYGLQKISITGSKFVQASGIYSYKDIDLINTDFENYTDISHIATTRWDGSNQKITVTNCKFINNKLISHSDGYSGLLRSQYLTCTGSLFLDNYAQQQGVISVSSHGNTHEFKDCIFLRNRAGNGVSGKSIFYSYTTTASFVLNNNWWGSNSTNNYVVPASVSYLKSGGLTQWLYLESTSPTEFDLTQNSTIDILYNLNHLSSTSSTWYYDASNLPSVVLNVTATKGEILNVSKIQNGQFTAKYDANEYSKDAKVIVEDNRHILSFNVYPEDSFYALQLLIDKNTNGTVDLTSDYHYYNDYDDSPVIISKNLIINGNGHVINGSCVSTIFTISGDDVSLNDLTMTNGKSTSDGGAISHTSGTLTISGSSFSDNVANNMGGAIYHGGGHLLISGSFFNYNKAVNLWGGAIYAITPISSLTSTSFTGNTAANGGGAIYANALINKIEYCNFISNSAAYGAALYQDYTDMIAITYSNFTSNRATLGGGAISTKGRNSITSSIFTRNTAGTVGGAVVYNGGNYNTAVSNSIILSNGADASVKDNLFSKSNSATFTLNNNWWGSNSSNKNNINDVIGDIPNGATLTQWLYIDSSSNVSEYDVFSIGKDASVVFSLNNYATSDSSGIYNNYKLPGIILNLTAYGGVVSDSHVKIGDSGVSDAVVFTFQESTTPSRIRAIYDGVEYSHIFKLNKYNVTVSVNSTVLPVTSPYGTTIAINGYINYPDGALMPKGSVYLTLGNKTYNAVVDSNGNFTLEISDALPGYYYSVNDVYFKEADDEVYYTGSDPETMDINRIAIYKVDTEVLNLTLSAEPYIYGMAITVSGIVKTSTGVYPYGNVTVYLDGNLNNPYRVQFNYPECSFK